MSICLHGRANDELEKILLNDSLYTAILGGQLLLGTADGRLADFRNSAKGCNFLLDLLPGRAEVTILRSPGAVDRRPVSLDTC